MQNKMVVRVGLVCLVVVVYLVVSQLGWMPKVAGPVAVGLVALIMFWPVKNGPEGGDLGPSRREMLEDIRAEQRARRK